MPGAPHGLDDLVDVRRRKIVQQLQLVVALALERIRVRAQPGALQPDLVLLQQEGRHGEAVRVLRAERLDAPVRPRVDGGEETRELGVVLRLPASRSYR